MNPFSLLPIYNYSREFCQNRLRADKVVTKEFDVKNAFAHVSRVSEGRTQSKHVLSRRFWLAKYWRKGSFFPRITLNTDLELHFQNSPKNKIENYRLLNCMVRKSLAKRFFRCKKFVGRCTGRFLTNVNTEYRSAIKGSCRVDTSSLDRLRHPPSPKKFGGHDKGVRKEAVMIDEGDAKLTWSEKSKACSKYYVGS